MKSNIRSMQKTDSWSTFQTNSKNHKALNDSRHPTFTPENNKQNIIEFTKDGKALDLNASLSSKVKIQQQVQPTQGEIFLVNCKKKLQQDKKHLRKFIKAKFTSSKSNPSLQFSHIVKQIQQSKNMLKNKKFKKIDLTVDTLPKFHQTLLYSQSQMENINRNIEIEEKIDLLENIINQTQTQQLRKKLKDQIKKFSKKYKDDEIFKKISNYYVSYEVLSMFLSIIYKDTSKISIKNQKRDLYLKIKKEMISFLANQDDSFTKIKQILQQQKERQNTTYSGEFNFYTKKSSSNFYGINQQGQEKSIQKKIEQLLEISKNTIKDALSQLNKFDIIAQMDLIFNKRVEQFNRYRFK